MTYGNYNNYNSSVNLYQTKFGANSSTGNISGPIEAVQKGIETGVDTFVEKIEKEKKKKSTKAAIAASSAVLVLSGLVMLFNPRHSAKTMQKLKLWEEQARLRMQQSKNNYLEGKFHKACTNIFKGCQSAFTIVSNGNSLKDVGFKYMCCEKDKKVKIKNKHLKKAFTAVDKGFTTIFNKPHKKITQWFDTISQKTVSSRYKHAGKSMNSLDSLIEDYSKGLSANAQEKVKNKLSEVKIARQYFTEDRVYQRLDNQGSLMKTLEGQIKDKWHKFTGGFKKDFKKDSKHIANHLTFWAEDIVQPQKDQVLAQGNKAVEKLLGNGKNTAGAYDDILNIMKDELDPKQYSILEKKLKIASSKLKKANHSECFEYFDKKRDLILGGAPTDIVTTLFGMGAAGLAIGKAKDKDERISKTVTIAIPAVIGLGVNLACAAAMLSGPVGILTGFAATIVTNRIATIFDKHVLGHNVDEEEEEVKEKQEKPVAKKMEVQYA